MIQQYCRQYSPTQTIKRETQQDAHDDRDTRNESRTELMVQSEQSHGSSSVICTSLDAAAFAAVAVAADTGRAAADDDDDDDEDRDIKT